MYQDLARRVAEDSDLLDLAAQAQPGQPAPNLLFAAVNFLLYKGTSHELRNFYPNHGGAYDPHRTFDPFKDFCLTHNRDIKKLLQTRLVQTNEVRRCALLIAGFFEVAKAGVKRIGLIDVGASSGLNLNLDRYQYKYSNGLTAGAPNSRLILDCEVQGNLQSTEIPHIESRIGIDLNPIDLSDPDELLWALALIWPDQPERAERLKRAAEIQKNFPVELIKDEANRAIENVAEKFPSDLPLAVIHSFTLNQFSVEDRSRFDENLKAISARREVWRLSLEWIGTKDSELTIDHYRDRMSQSHRVLATCHPHGAWIRPLS